jgi:hypothetical protein
MATKQEIIAELERRGVFNDPAKAPIISELRKRGVLPEVTQNQTAQPVSFSPPQDTAFDVRRRTDTLNVPADKQAQAMQELGAQARTGAMALPVIGAMALPMAAPAVGIIGGAALAGLGAAGGEGYRQTINAATGQPEKSSLEAAKKIGVAGAQGIAAEFGGRAAANVVGMGLKGTSGAIKNLSDYFSNVKRGTTATAAKAGVAPKFDVEAIQQYGQEISNAVKQRQQQLGSALDNATALYDNAVPEGAIDSREFLGQLTKIRESINSKPLAEIERAQVNKALDAITDKFANSIRQGKGNLGATEARDLLAEIRKPIDYDATQPGGGDALKRLQPLDAWLRRQISDKYQGVSRALNAYHNLINDAATLEKALGIEAGEKLTGSRVIEIEKNLNKLLKSDKISEEALQGIMERLGKPGLHKTGQSLAVAQQLTEPGAPASGFVGNTVRAITEPTMRAALPVAAGLSGALQSIVPSSRAGGLAAQILRARQQGR